MDPINLLQRAIDQTGRIVANVKPDQLGDSTPCADWDVKALLNHTVGCVSMFNEGAQTQPLDFGRFEQDLLGGDAGSAYDKAANELKATIGKPGAIDAMWTMPFGEVPGMIGASFATLELAQHGWDVAKATGQQVDFDAEVTEAALATARLAPSEQVRVPGVFGAEAPCADSAPTADQLAAFLGRTV
jgi:uncharacterized protein (TIGR03086 family)